MWGTSVCLHDPKKAKKHKKTQPNTGRDSRDKGGGMKKKWQKNRLKKGKLRLKSTEIWDENSHSSEDNRGRGTWEDRKRKRERIPENQPKRRK